MLPAKRAIERVPPAVGDLLARLRAGGGRAWLVGGTVRDLLRGQPPLDFDIATDLPPAAVLQLLPEASDRDAALGACRIAGLPWPVVVTTLRAEADYEDHRHPSRVWFVDDPEVDSSRRDFTVNALYLDPVRGELLDPTGGLDDLEALVLRTVGAPDLRFREDALRLLRALRFAAALPATLESATAAAANRNAGLLAHLSPHRVFEELTRTFRGPGRGRGLRLFVDLGFAAAVMPEVAAMDGVPQPPLYHPEGCVLTHTCLVLDHVPEGDTVLAWCAVLHDIGKPGTFRRAPDRIRFDGHDALSARMADGVLRRLGAPRELRETVVEVCRDHIRFAGLMAMRPRRRERWMRSPRFAAHLAFHRADCLGSHGDLSRYETARAALAALPAAAPPLVTGADVLALGLPSGPVVGEVLRAVTAELEAGDDPAPTRAAALALLRREVAKRIKTRS